MKVVSVEKIGKRQVYDITVDGNHEYVFANGVRTHNTGIMYSAQEVFVVGKSQIKDEDGLAGFTFTINIEKSRRVKEKSKIPLVVKFDGGLSRYSGLLQIALELGVVTKPKVGWLTREMCDPKTGEVINDRLWRLKEIEADEKKFFEPLLKKSRFKEMIREKYSVTNGKIIQQEEETIESLENVGETETSIDTTAESTNFLNEMMVGNGEMESFNSSYRNKD